MLTFAPVVEKNSTRRSREILTFRFAVGSRWSGVFAVASRSAFSTAVENSVENFGVQRLELRALGVIDYGFLGSHALDCSENASTGSASIPGSSRFPITGRENGILRLTVPTRGFQKMPAGELFRPAPARRRGNHQVRPSRLKFSVESPVPARRRGIAPVATTPSQVGPTDAADPQIYV